MSLLLTLIKGNIPLHTWKTYKQEEIEQRLANACGFFDTKKVEKIVNAIVNSMSHPDVVTLVVQEFATLPPIIRINLTDACNKAFGVRSGNKTKGISRANDLLGGKLLREEKFEQIVPHRREFFGGVRYERRVVNQAAAGAERLYANTALPANYDSLSKRDKKRAQREVNEIRRKERRGR